MNQNHVLGANKESCRCIGKDANVVQTLSGRRKLISLLLVYLSENYSDSLNPCSICRKSLVYLGRTFLIAGQWVCVDCVMKRMESAQPSPSYSGTEQ